MLIFHAGKLSQFWYVKMGLFPLLSERLIIARSCSPGVTIFDFQAQFYCPPSPKLPELAKTELLLIFQSMGWALLVSRPHTTLKYFSNPCLSYMGFNGNSCPSHWSEVTFCHSQHGPPWLLLFISNLWPSFLPIIVSPQPHISPWC